MNESNPTPRTLKAAIVVVAVLLMLASVLHGRAYARLRHVKQLQTAMSNLPPEQRREQAQQLRDAVGQLTPNQRRDLFADGRKQFEERMVQYTKMSPPEKVQYLDRAIDRMESFRRQMPNASTFTSGPRPPSNRSVEDRERMRRQRLDSTTPEFRAAMDQFRKDMEQRRRQRGLPPGGRR